MLDLKTASVLTGHSNLNTTARYLESSRTELVRAIENMSKTRRSDTG